jgi:hypothetical protein
MTLGMPELKSWQMWKVDMDGDTVTIGLHYRARNIALGEDTESEVAGQRIRFGTLDSRDYYDEESMVKAIEEEAWVVLSVQDKREKRLEWVRKNFS